MMNYIDSYKRKKMNNCSPCETLSFYYGKDMIEKLDVYRLPLRTSS
jgi:hypothetical protein